MDKKHLMIGLGVTLVVLVAIALVCISYILSPTVYVQKQGELELRSAPSALTDSGLRLRAEAWKEYPEYNIGMGAIAIVSFIGAIWVIRLMYRVRDSHFYVIEATESKSSGEK